MVCAEHILCSLAFVSMMKLISLLLVPANNLGARRAEFAGEDCWLCTRGAARGSSNRPLFVPLQESEFLTNAIMRPWTLSTSQTPHTQLDYSPDADLEVFTNKICPGGGFGPVSDDGYGVSYIIPNNSKIFFHVSSKKSCPNTNSERFVKTLDESMDEMKALFSF